MKKFVCFHLYNDFSGSPKVLRQVVRGMLEEGHEVVLVTSRGGVLDNAQPTVLSFSEKCTIHNFIAKGSKTFGSQLTPSATLVPLRQGDNIEGQQLLGQVPIVEMVRCGALFVLLQTTRKTLKSEMVREWGMLQEKFLKKLYEATAQEMAWVESDVARSLRDLREHIDWLPDGVDGELVAKRIDAVVERMSGERVRYGAYHGDFTPWNMFVEGGELFVFDWEYAGMSYPEGLDRYHFWMQTAIHEKHWGAEELRRYMCSDEGTWIDREMLEMDVLDVMSRYVMREGEKVKSLGAFEVWGMVNRY